MAKTFRVSILAEPGAFLLFLGWKQAQIKTPIGHLALDPRYSVPVAVGRVGTTRLHTFHFHVPNRARLSGVQISLQGAAMRARQGLRLSNAIHRRIRRN